MSSSSNQRVCQGVDRISNVPDTVLLHILSFIPAKSFVKTSILSKRWRYLWTNVPSLDFTEMPASTFRPSLTMPQNICLNFFIDRVLLHNVACYVHKVRFDLREDQYFYVNSWLSAITRREIREIDIEFWVSKSKEQLKPISFPARFLFSEKLIVLKLLGKFSIDVTALLHLPNVEIIILNGLQLPSDEFLKTLSLGCPVLKELRILGCNGITSILYVESLSLKILEISSTAINSKLSKCGIVVKAPNLRYLTIEEESLTEHVRIIDNLSFLVEAELSFENFGGAGFALELVRNLSTVEKLCLGQPAIFGYVGNPPIFQNLTFLSFVPDENMNQLLECIPRLKRLIIERVFFESEDFTFESKPVPNCLSSLEKIEFSQFDGLEEEMMLVAYLLNTALALKEMKISLYLTSFGQPEIDIYQELLMFPRASSDCQVVVRRYI